MPQQITDEQYYHIKGCLERAYQEVQDAYKVMYGNQGAPAAGAQSTQPNAGGKNYTANAPTVTKDHKAAVDAVNPEVQGQRAAEEQVSQSNLQKSISNDVLVVSASGNGSGDYFALVQDNNTMQQASLQIEEEEYTELQDVSAEDEVYLTIDQSQIDGAEWEPMRGTSSDPSGQCNCSGNVPSTNPYNDPKVEGEVASGHTRKCAFWDYNTITFDPQVGRACQVELDKVDASAVYGFDLYMANRHEILKRAADPNDPITLVDNDEGTEEFGYSAMLQQVTTMMGQVTGNPNQQVAFADDDEDDE